MPRAANRTSVDLPTDVYLKLARRAKLRNMTATMAIVVAIEIWLAYEDGADEDEPPHTPTPTASTPLDEPAPRDEAAEMRADALAELEEIIRNPRTPIAHLRTIVETLSGGDYQMARGAKGAVTWQLGDAAPVEAPTERHALLAAAALLLAEDDA
jgi:hypothetical protein